MHHTFLLPMLLVACCGGGQQSVTASEGQDVLVFYSTSTTSQQGTGSSGTRVRVDADGSVWIAHDASLSLCGTLDPSQLMALETAVRRALETGLREVYDTSAHPPPNANYSQTKTLDLHIDGEHARVRVDGWADVPPELAAVEAEINQATTSCTTPR